MNGDKLKKLQTVITKDQLIEMGIIPEKKQLIQGNVTKLEKEKLREYINEYNRNNEVATDSSKEIRKIIDKIINHKDINMINYELEYIKHDNSVLNERVNILIEETKLKEINNILRKQDLKRSSLIRCCVIHIARKE